MPLLSIKEVAAALSVSPQWLKYWLVANPIDAAGSPFYVRLGRSLKFEAKDVDRILAHLRQLEAARLGPSIKAKARLAGLMSHLGGYDHLKAVREAAEARRRPKTEPPKRRVRLPRRPRPSSE
ncbi:hypothetical protein [Bradyrhizobium brasilense]|uniref:hypothetical protein n=1 Tax=Bradyrhizobium brasilense TaxID=1419277 RepID=UPI001E3A0799|nr:hypothetical protein [Bradyrhizobium brasilense]MCC8976467.1 hypothetical protein [Bradyrhizobium brasilense]